MTLDEKIAFFFAPLLSPQPGGTISTLHLLRREAQDCLIETVLKDDEVIVRALRQPHRLFATHHRPSVHDGLFPCSIEARRMPQVRI